MRLGLVILGVCVALGIVEAAQLRFGAGELSEADWWIALVRTVPPWILLAAMSPLAVWAADRWPIRGEDWGRSLAIHAGFAVPFALLHLIAVATWATVRPASLGLGFAPVLGLLVARFAVYELLSYGALVGIVHAYRYHQEARERQALAASLLAELESARLRAAEGKLHPHFIFNTLNAITALAARGDQRGVITTLDAFSDLLRATLQDQSLKPVPLRDEIALLRSYLAIQTVRFGDRLRVEWDVDDEALDCTVPGLLLQPLVENALAHGIGRNPTGGTLEVRARLDRGVLHLEVSDTGPGTTGGRSQDQPEVAGQGIGLQTTRARLTALFGDAASLALEPRPDGGTRAAVRIPLSHRSSTSP